MKTIPSSTLAALSLAVSLLAAPELAAQTLPSGTYQATAELGAVLLDGRYPLALDEVPGLLEVTTSPTGALTGRVIILNEMIDVTGQLVSRQTYNRIVLRSKVQSKRLLLKATLQGGQFVGTLQFRSLRTPCRFDVTASGPIRGEYSLSLSVTANGAIAGPGTLLIAREQIPLKAKGRVAKNGIVSLSITGPKTFLRTTTGKLNGVGISAAKWTAQGFGALIKGQNLEVVPRP